MSFEDVIATNGNHYTIDKDSEQLEYDYDTPIGYSYKTTDGHRLIDDGNWNLSLMPEYEA